MTYPVKWYPSANVSPTSSDHTMDSNGTAEPDALLWAAREVLSACFMSPRQSRRDTWAYKSFRSIPMDMSARQRRAVRQLAAFFEDIK